MAFKRLQDFAALVKFSHTVFLFPFALAAVVLARQVRPIDLETLALIAAALVSARSAAMIMNRLADQGYDAANPRTAERPLVTGRVSRVQAWAWLVAACGVFILAAWLLNPLCLALSPLALAWVLGYSYSKRFTVLCHLWLGAAAALAPLGAWLAVTGVWDWRALVLSGAAALWVAGFDIIYACQDIGFDRDRGLHSIPARLGMRGALWVSRGLHALALIGFWALGPLFGLGAVYVVGFWLMAAALAAEQTLAAVKQANIPMAFFTVNGVVSIMFFCFVLADAAVGA